MQGCGTRPRLRFLVFIPIFFHHLFTNIWFYVWFIVRERVENFQRKITSWGYETNFFEKPILNPILKMGSYPQLLYYCPWTKKPFKNPYSRQLRIVNTVLSWSPAGQMDWPKSFFLQTKATHFETWMMTTVDEVNRDKTKVPD